MSTVTVSSCLIIILVVFQAGFIPGAAGHWHYGDEEHWHPLCKTGKQQSPIALSESFAVEKSFHPFNFEGYDLNHPAYLKNNGHSAEIRFPIAQQPTVDGGELPGIYKLDHLHFHWQSEHVVESYRFPLELHLVHYSQKYNSLEDALQHPQGVAVFSVLFYLSPEDDREFKPLIKIIDELRDNVGTVRQLTMNLYDFIPRDTAGYYRYLGSLTTPNCTEGIIWTVFTNALPISNNQAQYFLGMKTEEHKDLQHNYRDLQDLHSRTVYLQSSPMNFHGKSLYGSGAKFGSLPLILYIVFVGVLMKFY